MAVRMSSKDPLHNPLRDIAYCMYALAGKAYHRVRLEDWPELKEALAHHELSQQEYAKACVCICNYLADQRADMYRTSQLGTECTPFRKLLEYHGWFDCHPAAQVAAMSTIGLYTLGLHYNGLREVTWNNEGPAGDLEEMGYYAEQYVKVFRLPKWLRWFYRKTERLRRAWAVLTAKDTPNERTRV